MVLLSVLLTLFFIDGCRTGGSIPGRMQYLYRLEVVSLGGKIKLL